MSENLEVFPAFKDYLQPARFKVAWGGRGSGKSRFFVQLLVTNCLYFGWRIVCFREIMKSLDDSVYAELVAEIQRRKLDEHFNILRSEINCTTSGGVFKFDGLLRNAQKVKGYANFDCAFVEEAANVSADSWKMLIPTLRKSGSEVWVAFNPESPLDDTYKRFISQCKYPEFRDGKRYSIIKKINYTENPRFPQELIDDMEIMKETDYQLYRHVYLGEPVANSDLAIIPAHWAEAAIDIHKYLGINPSGSKRTGFDVADEGVDKNATCHGYGMVIQSLKEWHDTDPNSAANECWRQSLEYGSEEIIFDSIGVGAGAKGELRNEVDRYIYKSNIPPEITPFMANDSVINPDDDYQEGKTNQDMFLNVKAQLWWAMRDMCYNAWKARNGKDFDADYIVSFDSEMIGMDVLNNAIAELSQPRREYLSGKLRVEPKDRMKKRGVNSPNLADAIIMFIKPKEVNPFMAYNPR
jgi:phage terminase large subunit